jgi:hypothetical protein
MFFFNKTNLNPQTSLFLMEEQVKTIDPTLIYIETFKTGGVHVYKVEKDGLTYILKTNKPDDQWGIEHLQAERQILNMACDVSGITHLVKQYDGLAILKEYLSF